MGLMTDGWYDQKKGYVNPKMHTFVEHYRWGHLIDLPPYHGCNATNKTGTRKLIRYEIGKQCISPTWTCYLKETIWNQT